MSGHEDAFFHHPRIVDETIRRREYQVRIATKALQRSTLVVLPTGLGKTIVALMFIAERLHQRSGQVLMMAPTKPLVEQHRKFMEEHLVDVDIVMLTGEISPEKRKDIYGKADLVISTPQVVKNDILSGDLDMRKFHSMVVDEAHRSVGDYPYVFIAEMFYGSNPDGSVLGLTASPGHDVSRIYEVCRNLGMESIELRVDSDPDVSPYIQELEVKTVKVELSEGMRSVIGILERMFLERISKLQRMGVLRRGARTSVKELLGSASRIQEMIRKDTKGGGAYYQAMSIQAQAMKVSHAMELAETQGAEALYHYMDRLIKETGDPNCSKATRKVVSDPLFSMALNKVDSLREELPPKVEALERYIISKLREDPDSKIITFTHYRDTASVVFERLSRHLEKGVHPVRFVGQASRGTDQGMSQKVQKDILEGFRRGEYNVLIATSVAEEGLDIPGADLVIFYEPIPSEIRTIQRRGRTGRHKAGSVVVLVSRETRDIAYSFSAREKERKMERHLISLRRMLSSMPLPDRKERFRPEPKGPADVNATLASFDGPGEGADPGNEKGPAIIVDHRELSSSVCEELMRNGLNVRPASLGEGDYMVSDRVVVERKTAADLSDSLVDKRLFEQASRLAGRCERPMMIIEGDDIFNHRNIDRKALLGAIASISLDFGIPLMFTRDPAGTAEFLMALRRREGAKKGASVPERRPGGRKGEEILTEVLSGLPGISSRLAGRLLERFGSLKDVFNASVEDLMGVEGIGSARAREIYNAMNMKSR